MHGVKQAVLREFRMKREADEPALVAAVDYIRKGSADVGVERRFDART
jgi:hypothetical protein